MADTMVQNEPESAPTALQQGGRGTLYSYSFFDAELKETRRLLINTLLLPLTYLSICMWGVLSLFWGSTVSSSLSKLSVHVVNLDNGSFGAQVLAAINSSISEPGNNLNWVFDNNVGSEEASKALVVDEVAWAVVQVNLNVLDNLNNALKAASTYDPSSAVTIYYESARNQITSASKVLPAILAVINPVLGRLGSEQTAEFLAKNSGNQTTIQTSLGCPTCLTSPFLAGQVDLIPYDVSSASAPTMVGMIFLLTFAFSVFQILYINATLVGSKFRVRDAILFRILASSGAYLIMSLWYTMINLAFGIPMDRLFGKSGFMVYWMLNTCSMAALGMPMESLFTVIGQKWAGYFLSFWIVVNVSASFQSFELVPSFYQYGYGFPFFNSIQAARTIIFGTKSHLGQNFGILIAWAVAGAVGIAIFTARSLAKNKKAGQHLVK